MAVHDRDSEFSFLIKANIGVINTYQTGWRKELNLVQWNGGAEKFDIRDWDPEHEHMSRGITMHPEEAETLKDLLCGYFDDADADTEKKKE